MARMLVTDSDPDSAVSLQASLQVAGHHTAIAATAAAALREVNRAPPDLMLLAEQLSDGDGIGLLRKLCAAGYTFPVVMLSISDAASYEIAAFKAGAAEVIMKPAVEIEAFEMEPLLARLEARLAERTLRQRQDPRITIDGDRREVGTRSGIAQLTAREWELFMALHDAGGQFVNMSALKQRILGVRPLHSTGAVAIHKLRLLRKLTAVGLKDAIISRHSLGYRWNFPETDEVPVPVSEGAVTPKLRK